MCLAVPARIIETEVRDGHHVAAVRLGGITTRVRLDFLPGAGAGDYITVHAGFAISKADAEEAQRIYRLLGSVGLPHGDAGKRHAG